jgi:hypothetical protein
MLGFLVYPAKKHMALIVKGIFLGLPAGDLDGLKGGLS